MAQTSGTNLATNAAAISRVPCFELRIAWGRTTWPTDWATQSSDETARCMNYGYSRISIDPSEVGSEKPAELSITLNNQDQRYNVQHVQRHYRIHPWQHHDRRRRNRHIPQTARITRQVARGLHRRDQR